MSKSEGLPISTKDKLPENRGKADLMQHEVAIKSTESENGSDIKNKASIWALTNAKDT